MPSSGRLSCDDQTGRDERQTGHLLCSWQLEGEAQAADSCLERRVRQGLQRQRQLFRQLLPAGRLAPRPGARAEGQDLRQDDLPAAVRVGDEGRGHEHEGHLLPNHENAAQAIGECQRRLVQNRADVLSRLEDV